MKFTELLHGDPLAQVLLGRLRFTPIKLGVLALILASAYALLLPAVFDVLDPRPDVQSALADIPNLGILFVIGPAIWVYYAWQISTYESIHDDLVDCALDREQMATALELVRPRRSIAWGARIAVIVASTLSLVNIYLYGSQQGSTWLSYNWVMIGALQLVRWPTFYMLVMAINRQLHTAAAITRLLGHVRLKVVAMHPDGASGLGKLGRYTFASVYLILIGGLYLGLMVLRAGPGSLVPGEWGFPLVLLYLGLALLLFLWPLYRVHEQMVGAKEQLLGDIAVLFEQEFGQVVARLSEASLPPNAALRLRAYQKLYRIGEDMPEWPFSSVYLSRLIATFLLPILVPLGLNVAVIWLLR